MKELTEDVKAGGWRLEPPGGAFRGWSLGTSLFRHDFGRVPVGEFVAPVVGFVEKIDGDGLAGEIAEIDRDVSPFDVLAIAFDNGLMSSFTVNDDDELPVALFMRGNTQTKFDDGGGRQRRRDCQHGRFVA